MGLTSPTLQTCHNAPCSHFHAVPAGPCLAAEARMEAEEEMAEAAMPVDEIFYTEGSEELKTARLEVRGSPGY
jgi:hypothetical protein